MAVKFNVIGLMSGTSMDGLDLAHCKLVKKDNKWDFELVKGETIAYPSHWLDALNNARKLSDSDLSALSESYGQYMAKEVQGFIKRNQITGIDFVASHGHTIHHQPDKGITVQIGEGGIMADALKIPVVNDWDDVTINSHEACLLSLIHI